jgi:hypothetical protein
MLEDYVGAVDPVAFLDVQQMTAHLVRRLSIRRLAPVQPHIREIRQHHVQTCGVLRSTSRALSTSISMPDTCQSLQLVGHLAACCRPQSILFRGRASPGLGFALGGVDTLAA